MMGVAFAKRWLTVFLCLTVSACISPDNATVEGTGTPDVNGCSTIEGVADGADFVPQAAVMQGGDGRSHPDLFYLAWSKLDERTDLRFPARGYDGTGYEDKLLVSRRNATGEFNTWQVWPQINNDCEDVEKVRIHSFDVAPDGKSLFLSMSRDETDNPERKLGIYRLDIAAQTIEKISKDNSVDFLFPTYIGNDPETGNEVLMVAKTVQKTELNINYYQPQSVLQDEYDRAPTPLIHKMDVASGEVTLVGFNNSHQTEPMVMDDPDGNKIVVFNQWEHQENTNRFALWKMQIDGSDNFTFFGQESATSRDAANLYQPRAIRSGPYRGYVLMGQGARTNHPFVEEGHILMTKREHLELRSDKLFLSQLRNNNGVDEHIARSPEHYNDQSFTYAYRPNVDTAYAIYVKDFPASPSPDADPGVTPGIQVFGHQQYHLMQPRSFYPPESVTVVPSDGELGETRVSFTNEHLEGKAGFLVQNLGQSDNGVQHQLDGIAPEDLSMQFFIPSHHFNDSQTVGIGNSPEMSIPASGFIQPESDGSMGVILNSGLYVWKVNKRFEHTDHEGNTANIWVPVRSERQEVSFVPNRVNACNQCHQERDQANLDKYADYESIAAHKMLGDLSGLKGTANDISGYDYAAEDMPDFHRDIMPLLAKKSAVSGQSCMDCHNARDKLNLSNMTGVDSINSTYRNLMRGAHKVGDSESYKIPYITNSINPLGMDDNYPPAPFLWSLLLNDDLTLPEAEGYPNSSSRNLDRVGDFGAQYDAQIEQDIADINAQYDHSQHWSAADIQKFITFSTTQSPVGLSNVMGFEKDTISRSSPVAQKAYQVMVNNCYSCHNSHANWQYTDLLNGLGKPLEKAYLTDVDMKDSSTRFVIRRHINEKGDTHYSPYNWISHLERSMSETLTSAAHRVDFGNPTESELLVYARGGVAADGSTSESFNANISAAHPALDVNSAEYQTLLKWVNGDTDTLVNTAPVLDSVPAVTMAEYADPALLPQPITWSDADVGDLSQAFIQRQWTSEHNFTDSMLALEYDSFTQARVKTYAILGDRGTQNLSFAVTDGIRNPDVQTVPVTVSSDYNVPAPSANMPNAYAFYTVRATGELRKLRTDGQDELIGTIANYNGLTWTTMYRRADKGWLYFVEQETQRIHVVDEADASYLFSITFNHTPNKDAESHKQTVYLIWWRPAEGQPGDADYRPGALEGILESKLSEKKNGDWYVKLGDGEAPSTGNDKTVVPEYTTNMQGLGANTVAVYVWKRATFMSQWVNGGVDGLRVLNLVTGKPKTLSDFEFNAQDNGVSRYPSATYNNVRALVVAEDGAFYGFNKNLNASVEVFSFDPLSNTQTPVTNIPLWLQEYMDSPELYATPFVVVEPRSGDS